MQSLFNIQASGAIFGQLSIAWLLTGYLLELPLRRLAGWLLFVRKMLSFANILSNTSHLANKYMRQYHSHSVEQEVEWLYSFDVHANAFFCSFLITYVLQVCYFIEIAIANFKHVFWQYFLLPFLLGRAIISCILSNTLYALATIWYAYITHLGYRGKFLLFCN